MIKKVDVSNLTLPESEKVVDSLYKSMDLYCPKCKSTDIKRKFIVPVSIYGHLPKSPVDICRSCGFDSQESFSSINFRERRNYKIQQLLKEDGIQ